MHDRYRTTPIALPGYTPVAQPEIDVLFANAKLGKMRDHVAFGIRNGKTIEEIRIDDAPVAGIGIVADAEALRIF